MDPDLLASQKPGDLDLHCFQNRIYLGSRVNLLCPFHSAQFNYESTLAL